MQGIAANKDAKIFKRAFAIFREKIIFAQTQWWLSYVRDPSSMQGVHSTVET
jgi:hypothetical protein